MYIHVAYQVHIGKSLQSVETLECRNRGVIVSVLTTSEVDSVFEPVRSEQRHLLFLHQAHIITE